MREAAAHQIEHGFPGLGERGIALLHGATRVARNDAGLDRLAAVVRPDLERATVAPGVGRVHQVEIDDVDRQAAQRPVAGLEHVVRRVIGLPQLGDQLDALPIDAAREQRAAQDRLAAVDLCGVVERAPGVDRGVDRRL